MKSVPEKRLGSRYVVKTENKSSFANQIDLRLPSEKVWFFFNFPHFFLQSLTRTLIPGNAYVLVDDDKDDSDSKAEKVDEAKKEEEKVRKAKEERMSRSTTGCKIGVTLSNADVSCF